MMASIWQPGRHSLLGAVIENSSSTKGHEGHEGHEGLLEAFLKAMKAMKAYQGNDGHEGHEGHESEKSLASLDFLLVRGLSILFPHHPKRIQSIHHPHPKCFHIHHPLWCIAGFCETNPQTTLVSTFDACAAVWKKGRISVSIVNQWEAS